MEGAVLFFYPVDIAPIIRFRALRENDDGGVLIQRIQEKLAPVDQLLLVVAAAFPPAMQEQDERIALVLIEIMGIEDAIIERIPLVQVLLI